MKFAQELEKKVKDTIKKYNLSNKKDKIIVACSGGKDSTATLYLLKKFGYNVEALIIDLLIGAWSDKSLENVKTFCKKYKIKLHVINMRKEFGNSICHIRSSIQGKTKLSNCAICGVIKRWLLNKKSRELKAVKLATGHNLDDEVETILMNNFKGNPGLNINLGPKTGIVNNKKFVQRIKPLYFLTNREIKKYSVAMKFPVMYEPCPCSKAAFRNDIKKFIADMEEQYPKIKINIIENFLKIREDLRKSYKSDKKLKSCEICNEPSRKSICRRCELISTIKG